MPALIRNLTAQPQTQPQTATASGSSDPLRQQTYGGSIEFSLSRSHNRCLLEQERLDRAELL